MNSSDQFSKKVEKENAFREKGSTYVWIRRFLGQDQKRNYTKQYMKVMSAEYYRPKVSEMINLNSIIVYNLSATEMSLLNSLNHSLFVQNDPQKTCN